MNKKDNPILSPLFEVTDEESLEPLEVQEYQDQTTMLEKRVATQEGRYRGMQGSTTGG